MFLLSNKKNYCFSLLFALMGVLTACGGDDDIVSANENSESALAVNERPTDWVAVTENVDPKSSMAVDVAIDLSHLSMTYKTDTQDLVAAFVNGTCRAVASANYENIQKADSSDCIFMLTVRKLTTDPANAGVELKFYSARLKHIFTATAFEYVNEGIKGTISAPFKPEWKR